VTTQPSQHNISNLKIWSAEIPILQMGHLGVDVIFGVMHLQQKAEVQKTVRIP
jgi:hypothetical protein